MEGIQFYAHARLTQPSLDSVEVWLTTHSTLPYAHEVRFGGCGGNAQFQTAPARKGDPVHTWDSLSSLTAIYKAHGIAYGCSAVLFISSIPANYDTTTKAFTIAIKDVLGDSLPMGRYAVTITAPFQGVNPVPAGVVDLNSNSLSRGP